MTKPFPRDRALRNAYAQAPSARRQRRALAKELQQLTFPAPEVERVDVIKLIVDTAALARIVRRNDALAEIDARSRVYVAPLPLAAGDLAIADGPGGWSSRPFWTVVECSCDLCGLGRHVAVDQPFDGGWRHISRAALRRRGETSATQAERWADVVTQLDGAARITESGHDAGFGPLTEWLAEMAAVSTGQTT